MSACFLAVWQAKNVFMRASFLTLFERF